MKLYKKIILGIIFAIAVYYIAGMTNNTVSTQLVSRGVIEDSVLKTGYIVRDEKLIVTDDGGLVDSFLANGERVSKGNMVAMLYKSKVDPAISSKLKELNERIDSLEKLIDSSKSAGYSSNNNFNLSISSLSKELIFNVKEENGTGISNIKTRFDELLDKNIANNEENAHNLLQKLNSEKKSIEDSIVGEKTMLYAPDSGLYFSEFDGYEGVISSESVMTMTPSSYKQLNEIKGKDYKIGTVAKVIHGFTWSVMTMMDVKEANKFSVDESVSLRLPEHSDEKVSATVIYKSEEENGKVVIVVQTDKYLESAYYYRKVNVEIIKNTFSGLKVPKEAVKASNGVTGVYIVKDAVAKFRPIEVLVSSEKYVIVKEDNSKTDNLLLYDMVITSGNNIEHNKKIKY